MAYRCAAACVRQHRRSQPHGTRADSAGLLIAEILDEASFPPGVLNVVTMRQEKLETS